MLKEAISALENAELLLAHVLGITRVKLLTSHDNGLNEAQERQFQALLSRRMKREPMAYIVGQKEFWSLDFKVSPAVLCPRPDTETLVQKALK